MNSLAQHLENLIEQDEGGHFKLFVKRRFSLVVFRLTLPSSSTTPEVLDQLNKAFFKLVAERVDIHLTPTVVGGFYSTRVAVGSPTTEVKHIEALWKVIKELAEVARNGMGL